MEKNLQHLFGPTRAFAGNLNTVPYVHSLELSLDKVEDVDRVALALLEFDGVLGVITNLDFCGRHVCTLHILQSSLSQ